MDSLRGNFGHDAAFGDDSRDYDPTEDDTGREAPPASIGTDERRMQVRAYNHWASLLQDRNFPSIEDLDPDALPDFGPYSVLLDFTAGVENPGIGYLGTKLAHECGADEDIAQLDDVPSRSLLSRITDHYMQILANQAPIGFEAEFINQQDRTIAYRGILLPFSSDDDTIDFIYGVINWKELADQFTTDELLLEIDQALDQQDADLPPLRAASALNDWADSPLPAALDEDGEDEEDMEEEGAGETLNLGSLIRIGSGGKRPALPTPVFGSFDEDPFADHPTGDAGPGDDMLSYGHSSCPAPDDAPAYPRIELEDVAEADMVLGDWLASARELAEAARSSEDRTRQTLYAAIGRAYDFSLVAAEAPEDFVELMADSGLTMQERAPMTPVVKLVFGAGYDKTRLTEYAAALSHAHRLQLARGQFADFLGAAEGGLKGVVTAERRLRREESGRQSGPVEAPRERLARKLRKLEPKGFAEIARDGQEFALVMIRRMPDDTVAVLGEVGDDITLVERAARSLLA